MSKLYRYLTEEDSSAFRHKVSSALAKGWTLYGTSDCVFDESTGTLRCDQAVVKYVDADYRSDMKLSE
jgi:hypothetical protein